MKAWGVGILGMLFWINISNAGCNLANGTTVSFIFGKAAEGSAGNVYGYDTMNTSESNDDHVSVASGASTWVRVTIDANDDGVADAYSDLSNFSFSSSDSCVTVGSMPSSTTASGFLLQISGEPNQTGEAKVTANANSDVCGEIQINVYSDKSLDHWTIYNLSTENLPFTQTGAENYVDSVSKQGVLSYANITLDASKSINYDDNSNGVFDFYFDGGTQPEFVLLAPLQTTGNALSSVVVDEIHGVWRLTSTAAEGATNITVLGTSMLWKFVGKSLMINDDVNQERVELLSIDGNELTLQDPLENSYAGNPELSSWAVGGISQNPQIISYGDDSTLLTILLHETLHRQLAGPLSDLNDAKSANNVMNYIISGNGTELRFLELLIDGSTQKESQWQSIH